MLHIHRLADPPMIPQCGEIIDNCAACMKPSVYLLYNRCDEPLCLIVFECTCLTTTCTPCCPLCGTRPPPVSKTARDIVRQLSSCKHIHPYDSVCESTHRKAQSDAYRRIAEQLKFQDIFCFFRTAARSRGLATIPYLRVLLLAGASGRHDGALGWRGAGGRHPEDAILHSRRCRFA